MTVTAPGAQIPQPTALHPTMLVALTPTQSQQVFRACLNALSRPGTVVALPAVDHTPPLALPALALADWAAPVAHLDIPAMADDVARVTHAPRVPVAAARWVLGTGAARLDGIAVGTPLRPDQGATVCLGVDDVTAGPEASLRGPGIADTAAVRIAGLGAHVWADRARHVGTPPCGIDLLLIDAHHRMVAIPRTTTVEAQP